MTTKNDHINVEPIYLLVRASSEKYDLLCDSPKVEDSPGLFGAGELQAPLRFKDPAKGEIFSPDDIVMYVRAVDESVIARYLKIFTEGDYVKVTEIGDFENDWPGEAQEVTDLGLEDFLMLLPPKGGWADI
jgi:hypothetical protein